MSVKLGEVHRDLKFNNQKTKYGKRNAAKQPKVKTVINASEFTYCPTQNTCTCPAGKRLLKTKDGCDSKGIHKVFFEGRLTDCRACELNQQCMKNPDAANHRKGHGRQVSFIVESKREPTHTDWKKERVDSEYGKLIYSHRMSVIEPVFGNIGTNKGLNRFSLRGNKKVQNQWKLYCLVHNIEKLKNYGNIAA